MTGVYGPPFASLRWRWVRCVGGAPCSQAWKLSPRARVRPTRPKAQQAWPKSAQFHSISRRDEIGADNCRLGPPGNPHGATVPARSNSAPSVQFVGALVREHRKRENPDLAYRRAGLIPSTGLGRGRTQLCEFQPQAMRNNSSGWHVRA